jgi:tight adherence protein B
MQPLQIILIALLLVFVFGIVIAFVITNRAQQKKRMRSIIQGNLVSEINVLDPKDEQNRRRAEIAKKLRQTKEEENDGKELRLTLPLRIERAGLSLSVKTFWIYSFISMFVMLGLGLLLGQAPFVLVMMTIIGLLGIPRFVLRTMTNKRQKNFLQEFPDALEAMVRLLKAGMPVSEAIAMISREYTGPVGEEMSRIYDKQKIGVPLHEAATEATRRMPLTEMQMFATGLSIQAQTGSSLSEVLLNLAGVIRARFRLKRKIKALSSEAIASASIIGALPNLVAGGMYFANREYIMVLFTDPFGKVLLVGSVVWMCMGIMMMKAMINFKV